jgi:hypothetical protein
MVPCLVFIKGNPDDSQPGLRKVSICAEETLFVSSQNIALLYTKNKIKDVTQGTSYHAGILSDTILTIARINKHRSQGAVTVYYWGNDASPKQKVFTIKYKDSDDIFVHREKCDRPPEPSPGPEKANGILSSDFKNIEVPYREKHGKSPPTNHR